MYLMTTSVLIMVEIEIETFILKRRIVNLYIIFNIQDKRIEIEENNKIEKESNYIYEAQTKELANSQKIIFKVKVLKIMNRKSEKVIEIYNTKDGFLQIYNMNKVN